MGKNLINNKGEEVAPDFSSCPVNALYFSASWCGPCRQFTPILSEFYKYVNKHDKNNFEIIFASRDRAPREFLDYYTKMPWLSLEWDRMQTLVQKLAGIYKLQG